MEQTTANLYEKRTQLQKELDSLLDEKHVFKISSARKNSYNLGYSVYNYRTLSASFLTEIKKLTEAHIKQQIEEIDKELKDL